MSISITIILVQNFFGITLLGNILLWDSSLSKKEFTSSSDEGECVFRRNGPLLWLAWKANVTMLTTIHEAVMVEIGQTDFFGNKFEKPEAVYYYCGQMGGVDLSDQLVNYYSFLWKSMKWSRKLLIHQLNLLILNAYILNKNYGCEKLTHDEYRDRIVKYFLRSGKEK